MIKKALVIAPHPDDEINLAGQLIISLVKKGVEIFVAYTTNGDAEEKIGNVRIKEAINANAILGIDEEHVIFLGYPNEWQGNIHIYNENPTKQLTSKLGKIETNSIASHHEFCYKQHGVHRLFTRENFKCDFKEMIEFVSADFIIAPEFDSHPDHRAASLLFDEIMGEILKEHMEYRPIVLKKYIHEGVWNGPKDYYQMFPTMTDGPREYAGGIHELDSPCFKWDERLCFDVESSTQTELLTNNIIYKAAKKHRATTAWYEMQRVINGDVVYWNRSTNNLALSAEIEATSGDASFLNDFLLYGSNDVMNIKEPFEHDNQYCWCPEINDDEKKVFIKFEQSKHLSKIIVYEDCNIKNHVNRLRISANGYSTIVELNVDGSGTVIDLNNCVSDIIELQVLDYKGVAAISEIEIYSDFRNLPTEVLCKRNEEKKRFVSVRKHNLCQKIEKTYLIIKFLFVFKIKYEINKRLIL